MAKGPLHLIRGSGEQEKLLKNAKTQFTAEQEEISTYLAIEVFATKVGDSETAKLARDIRKDEERMAKFLDTQIRQLAAATALEEVPAARPRRKRRPRKAGRPKKRSPAKPKKASAKKAAAKSSTKKASTKSKAAKKPAAKRSKAKAKR